MLEEVRHSPLQQQCTLEWATHSSSPCIGPPGPPSLLGWPVFAPAHPTTAALHAHQQSNALVGTVSPHRDEATLAHMQLVMPSMARFPRDPSANRLSSLNGALTGKICYKDSLCVVKFVLRCQMYKCVQIAW